MNSKSEALRLAAMGYHVIPTHRVDHGQCSCGSAICPSPGKHPRTIHGVHDATLDPETIEKWWAAMPDAWLAICPDPEWLVVDVDPRHGGDHKWGRIVAETGIDPADVDIIGEIDDNVVASTGYVITPFVGFVPYPYPFSPNVSETKEIFFVPLSLLMDESRFRDQERVIGPYSYQGPIFDYDGHIIWGATARILKHLVSLLAATDDSSGPVLCDSSG